MQRQEGGREEGLWGEYESLLDLGMWGPPGAFGGGVGGTVMRLRCGPLAKPSQPVAPVLDAGKSPLAVLRTDPGPSS